MERIDWRGYFDGVMDSDSDRRLSILPAKATGGRMPFAACVWNSIHGYKQSVSRQILACCCNISQFPLSEMYGYPFRRDLLKSGINPKFFFDINTLARSCPAGTSFAFVIT
jgi:hypothetical protein